MKSVLISIQPEWVEKIFAGIKTIELRKSFPSLETPFQCFVYMTKKRHKFNLLREMGRRDDAEILESSFGKVVGCFTCDRNYYIRWNAMQEQLEYPFDLKDTCVSTLHFLEYYDHASGFGWHIADTALFEDGFPLGCFLKTQVKACRFDKSKNCSRCEAASGCADRIFKTPPQSWCYCDAGIITPLLIKEE